jgi:hypothetical protein
MPHSLFGDVDVPGAAWRQVRSLPIADVFVRALKLRIWLDGGATLSS